MGWTIKGMTENLVVASRKRVLLAALLLPLTTPVSAETLAEAMAAAAAHHPTLRAEKARNQAAHVGIDIARSGYYPRVNASGDIGAASGSRGLYAGSDGGVGNSGSRALNDGWGGRWGYSLSAEQPLFDGWRTQSAVAEAHSGAEAATSQVRVAEQSVLLEAVIAFADVVRDRQIEALRTRSRAMLEEEVTAALERMKHKAGTETDVAQTRARHAQAIADLIVAKAETKVSLAEYERVVGRPPRKLDRPKVPESLLPNSIETAVASATSFNPATATAASREEASRHTIDRLAADGLPQVKLRGGIDGERSLSSGNDERDRDSASIAVRVTVPLFDGGESSARVQQARHINVSLAEEARAVRERVHASVTGAWARTVASRQRLAFEQQSVESSRKALDGVREEIRLGHRATVEGLDAQRELTASEVRLAASERDLIVSAYALIATTGQLALNDGHEAGRIASSADKPGKKSVQSRGTDAGAAWQPVVKRKP